METRPPDPSILRALGRETYQDQLEFFPFGSAVVDSRLRVWHANLRLCLLLRAERRAVTGHIFSRWINTTDGVRLSDLIEECQNADATRECELTLRGPDGSERRVLVRATPLPARNKQLFSLGILDVHERLEAFASSRAIVLRYRLLLYASAEALVVVDKSGVVVEFNPPAYQLLMPEVGELVGRSLVELIGRLCDGGSPEDDGSLRGLQQAVKTGRPLQLTRAVNHRLAHRYLELKCDPVRDQTGRWVGPSLVRFRDVTREHRVAEAREAFLSTLAHEIRSPLTSILGSLRLISSAATTDVLDETNQSLLEAAERNAIHLKCLAEDLLDYQKSLGGAVRQLETVDLRDIADRASQMFRTQSRDAGVTLSVVSDDVAADVLGEETRLTQLATNLLANAIKHSPAGATVVIRTAVHRGFVMLSVRDSGPGIPVDQQAHVFRPFVQTGVGEAKGGAGLGLFIAEQIAVRHRAKIIIETPPNGGTLMVVEFPRLDGGSLKPRRVDGKKR